MLTWQEVGPNTRREDVDEVLSRLSEMHPWTTWPLSQITSLYMALTGPGAFGLPYTHPLCVKVSGEAWRIANVASPDYNLQDSAIRRSR